MIKGEFRQAVLSGDRYSFWYFSFYFNKLLEFWKPLKRPTVEFLGMFQINAISISVIQNDPAKTAKLRIAV